MKDAAESLKAAGVDANFLLFLEYTDALKYVADHAQGKVIFMDNGAARLDTRGAGHPDHGRGAAGGAAGLRAGPAPSRPDLVVIEPGSGARSARASVPVSS